MLTLLRNLAGDHPAVLVVEDSHWADRSSLDLLDFLVRSQRAVPALLLVVTYRTDELDRGHPLRPMLAQLERLRWVERLELLPGFCEKCSGSLIEHRRAEAAPGRRAASRHLTAIFRWLCDHARQ